jgi:hypothetical protein
MHRSRLSATSETINMVGLLFRATVLSVVGMCLIIPHRAAAQCIPEPTTLVKGTVSLGSRNERDYVSGAKIIVQGDLMTLSAVTDHEGKFGFSNLEPGTYTVEATHLGLHAEQTITVEAGTKVQVVLQLKLPDRETSPKP